MLFPEMLSLDTRLNITPFSIHKVSGSSRIWGLFGPMTHHAKKGKGLQIKPMLPLYPGPSQGIIFICFQAFYINFFLVLHFGNNW